MAVLGFVTMILKKLKFKLGVFEVLAEFTRLLFISYQKNPACALNEFKASLKP